MAASSSPVATLPRALVDALVGFVLGESDLALWPQLVRDGSASFLALDATPANEEPPANRAAFASFACVCRDWHAAAVDAASANALRSLTVECNGRPSRSNAVALRNRIVLQRTRLQRLVISTPSAMGTRDDALDQWKAVLAHASQLLELEVSISPLELGDGAVHIVRAATTHCPQLQSLLLSTHHPYAMRDGPTSPFVPIRERNRMFSRYRDLSELVRAVYACAESVQASTGGLTTLRLPLGPFLAERIANANDVLAFLTRCCPNIQVFDGYRDSIVNYDPVVCREQWMLDLRAVATAYFEAFGVTVKPRLEKLEIVASGWDWARFATSVDVQTIAIVHETGFTTTTTNVHTILRACPQLKDLCVIWSYDTEPGDDTATMNPEVFGDEFCHALVEHCKELRTLTLKSLPPRVDPSMSLQQFTDASMRRLATLPQLRDVSLGGCNITGDGLFDLVLGHVAETRHPRRYEVYLGDCWTGRPPSATARAFYDSLVRLLERLVEVEDGELPCGTRAVSLVLENGDFHAVKGRPTAPYLAHVRALATRVRQQRPQITMCCVVEAFDAVDGSFATIKSLRLSTGQSVAWQDVDQAEAMIRGEYTDAPMDDVFVTRTYLD